MEVQVATPVIRRPVRARGEMPRERLAEAAEKMADSPLKDTLKRIAAQPKNPRSKP